MGREAMRMADHHAYATTWTMAPLPAVRTSPTSAAWQSTQKTDNTSDGTTGPTAMDVCHQGSDGVA
jgi:hypothetical protein